MTRYEAALTLKESVPLKITTQPRLANLRAPGFSACFQSNMPENAISRERAAQALGFLFRQSGIYPTHSSRSSDQN